MENRNGVVPRLSVSTWSLHRSLGQPQLYGPAHGLHIPVETHGRGATSLLELPARLAAFGIHTLEICHFHLPSLDHGYLAELRSALAQANVELFSLLIDGGNITDPVHANRELSWIRAWLEIAGLLGAKCARVSAGMNKFSEETLHASVRGLHYLTGPAQLYGLRLMTENWHTLLSTPTAVLTVLDRLEGQLGLCFDFGNWQGATKYTDLEAIVARAESCHTKAHFASPYAIDRADYVRCLDITRSAGFTGPYTLIYDGPTPDEWQGLAIEKEIVQPYLQPAQ